MKTALWKNQISDNLKEAILKEIDTHQEEDIKQLKASHKMLLSSNRHKTQLIKRLKRTLAKMQGVEVHQINIE